MSAVVDVEVVVFPIPLGPGRMAKIAYPADLTPAEAEKIAALVKALSTKTTKTT